jgi:DnaD/phage-associated family protein
MESKTEYITTEEVEEGLAMLGKGYEDQPSVVVEPPRRRLERRGKQMTEVEEAAYVKFSTEFKAELADLDVYALKVFIYIGLSINFETGAAYPGVRKIAKETKMNKDTVAKAVEELEEKGFLRVQRRDGSSNIYKPECYVAIGETVPSGRTPHEPSGFGAQLSDGKQELSDENAQLSDARRVNLHNQNNKNLKQEEQKEEEVNPLFVLYQNNISMLTPRIADWLEEAEKTYSFEWVKESIDIAFKNGAKSWNYCETILKRWKQNGKNERPGKRVSVAASGNHSKYLESEYADYIEH